MAEKILNTRIQLKGDTYAQWKQHNPTLKENEIAIVVVEAGDGAPVVNTGVYFKRGDGSSAFNDLGFMSGIAGDVYTWAKAETKPAYSASEITGLGAAIEDYVQDEMGISVDTNTVYQIVKGTDDYTYKLQSKAAADGEESWVDVSSIAIPKYDDTQVKADISAVSTLVGDIAVATQIANAITALDLANTYDAKGAADAAKTAAVTEAKEYADTKVASVSASDNSIAVAGTSTAPTVGVKISVEAGNDLILKDDGLYVDVPAAAVYTVAKDDSSVEYAAVYHLQKDGENVGAAINIPKDMVVQSGEVVVDPEGQAKGTYLKLVLANAANDTIYINVGSLIEYVTSGSAESDMVVVTIDEQHKVTATITDGTVTKAKLVAEVQTTLNKADSALQKADITTGTKPGTISVDGGDIEVQGLGGAAYKEVSYFEQDAQAKADAAKEAVVGTAADASTVMTIYGARAYAQELDTQALAQLKVEDTATEKQFVTAVSQANGKISVTRKALEATDIPTIEQSQVNGLATALNTKANDAELAAIAKSGNAKDLVQTEGDYLIFDCGSATKNID